VVCTTGEERGGLCYAHAARVSLSMNDLVRSGNARLLYYVELVGSCAVKWRKYGVALIISPTAQREF